MTSQEALTIIQKSQRIQDIIKDMSNLDAEFRKLIQLLHPDACSLPGATDATTKLVALRKEHKNGKSFVDDAGSFSTNGEFLEFTGDPNLLEKSFRNYAILKSLPDTEVLKKYLPSKMKFSKKEGKLRIDFPLRAIPLNEVHSIRSLPQEHVNWILSRLLEFSSLLHVAGYNHNGLNPESVFLIPENHGIVVVSFYHLSKSNSTLETLSGRYKFWYPDSVFKSKVSTGIDVELSKRIAVYLSGASSAIALKKTHNPEWVDFLITSSDDIVKSMIDYRSIIDNNFKKKFHILNI